MGTAVAPSFQATAGYDLATGLGTVNVANLATAWATAGLTATTTTITASPSGTITHGANASFTVTVAGAGGPPTGQVSLIATPASAPQTGIGPFTLASGAKTFTTNMLPGGTAYNVVAHYSGDGTFAQSDSAPVTVTVSKESSKTFVSLVTFDPNTGGIANSNATTAAYGSPYIMRIDVTNAASAACSDNSDAGTIPPIDTIPCPTGNVTVTDNSAPLNDFLNSNTGVTSNIVPLNRHGYFEDQPIQLPAGSHSIVAAYAGDNSYTASTSAADAISITKAATAVAMTPWQMPPSTRPLPSPRRLPPTAAESAPRERSPSVPEVHRWEPRRSWDQQPRAVPRLAVRQRFPPPSPLPERKMLPPLTVATLITPPPGRPRPFPLT